MHPKEVKQFKIGILKEDGFYELPESIENITLEPEEPIEITSLGNSGPIIFDRYRSFECSFELKNNNQKFFRNIIYGLNNWRKMHGLPMIRMWSKKYEE